MLTDSRFIAGVVVGVVGFVAFNRFVKNVPGKGQ